MRSKFKTLRQVTQQLFDRQAHQLTAAIRYCVGCGPEDSGVTFGVRPRENDPLFGLPIG